MLFVLLYVDRTSIIIINICQKLFYNKERGNLSWMKKKENSRQPDVNLDAIPDAVRIVQAAPAQEAAAASPRAF